MKVVVCGSGVIGVTSAYYLTTLGHEVVVVDRQPGPGLETSFANAGQVSWGYASPWAAPGIPLKALGWMLSGHSPLVIRPRFDPTMWRWLMSMLANCTAARYALNKERMLRLAMFSHTCLGELRRELGLTYDDRQLGTLQLFRDQKGLDGAAADSAILRRWNVPHKLLSPEECLKVEPGLSSVKDKIAGGLHLPGDETGDCFKFTQALAALTEQRGASFRYGVTVRDIRLDGNRITRLETTAGPLEGDAYLLAMGSYTPLLLRRLGVAIPVYPVKGYSVTIPITDPAASPTSTIMDERHKVAITRLGDRIRAAGTAELTGYDLTLTKSRCRMIADVVRDLFPKGGDESRAEFWTGLRSMTPDGPPIIGTTPFRNLFLNTGHGTLGWTMACGAGRLVAEIISNAVPSIDISGLTIGRYRR
jgi:D-amino-acid dehydrogenase